MTTSGSGQVSSLVAALGAFRTCPHDRGLTYDGPVGAPRGWAAVVAALATAEDAGMMCPDVDGHAEHHGVLVLLDTDGAEVEDRCIPDAAAWAWWRRTLDLRRVSGVCAGCPATGATD